MKRTGAPPRSTRRMCEDMADAVLDLFVEHMQAAAKLDDDILLEPQELVVQKRAFKDKRKKKYIRVIRKIAEEWLNEVEKDHWGQSRKRPFDRILVKRFSHLFPPSESLDDPGAVSRRILPGLLLAFERLAGAEFIDQCQGAARRIFRQLKEDQGAEFTWNDYYTHPAANDLVDDLLAVIAWSFKDINIRMKWLLDLINRHLAPPEDYAFEGESVHRWTLKPEGLMELLRALFSEFGEKLANEGTRGQLEHRYGEKACEIISDVIKQVEA